MDIRKSTGSDFCYQYRALRASATDAQIASYCTGVRALFRPIAVEFDPRENGLWVLRHYLALKFAVSASILSGSSIYAAEHNLLMGVSYFNYYTLLNCCRALLMTAPDVEWQGAETVKLSHRKILHRAGEILIRLSPEKAQQWREDLTAARAYREVFSYRFPATGPGLLRENAIDPRPVAELGRLLVELAMLNSECFDGVLRDHAPTDISIQSVTDHDWASAYEIAGEKVIDPDDQYRFGKFLCGWKRVSTLEVMASDGLIEDFYGGWCAADPGEGDFDPDEWVDHLLWL